MLPLVGSAPSMFVTPASCEEASENCAPGSESRQAGAWPPQPPLPPSAKEPAYSAASA
jgi:hypothetical protein